MQKRKDSLSALKICRFCLTQDEQLKNLYDRKRVSKDTVTLPLKILSSISVEVYPSDKMPTFICERCKYFMELCYEYKQMCRQADESILQYIQKGTAIETLEWPSSLVKIFQQFSKNSNPTFVETVIEGGATIQVSSQDVSDSEEEENENVYNVKIGDGAEDRACIKVVTSKDNQEIEAAATKASPKKTVKGSADQPMLDSEERWACDECDYTYPLQQLLELHKMQKHRARKVQCNQCNAKFFSKYDLISHQICHSEDLPFRCVVCNKKFKRHVLLKRHERLNHADMPQMSCINCPATFISSDELEAHKKKHARNSRNYVCTACDKRFFGKAALQRHTDLVHNNAQQFSCEYCPQRFTSVPKLTRHVRMHAGERAYPCKYCSKSFVKSHHYTRHLRLKHNQTSSSPHGSFTTADNYRCEQCEDTFPTQDDLIYHSAIHATQNLICPLCQEKFETVDEVTTHIKSHVNGIEFMCELCELVFTAKEKLEAHMRMAHDEEMLENEGVEDESSMDVDVEDDDDAINVKEEDDHMVVEIKKPSGFMLSNSQNGTDEKPDINNSEESEAEVTYTELSNVDTISLAKRDVVDVVEPVGKVDATLTKLTPTKVSYSDVQSTTILRKAEDIKQKIVQPTVETVAKKEKTTKVDNNSGAGASEKSLRLLEKELQELQRTNTRNESSSLSNQSKTSTKALETVRSRRPQLFTSTPKSRVAEEKKILTSRIIPTEKKTSERRVITKENKEPKEIKNTSASNNVTNKEEKNNGIKEEKPNNNNKEDKEVKEKEIPKNTSGEGGVRRSTRPCKIKDYAKMIRDRSQEDSDDDEDSDDTNDEEYKETELEARQKPRRSITKPAPKTVTATPAAGASAPRKRGRPRKDASLVVPPKVKKEEDDEAEGSESTQKVVQKAAGATKMDQEEPATIELDDDDTIDSVQNESTSPTNETKQNNAEQNKSGGVLVSPTGQTLKKVPIKALPPGVKPLPLPVSARPMGAGELCEMQIGKKMVKVQKIVMTKAEVEAMAKKGLVEMKDGTMVLKQGIKLPSCDSVSLKEKQSPIKREKPAPSRCDIED